MSLCALLQTLARDGTSRAERERAASGLYSELRRFGGGVIRRRFSRTADVTVDEAVQKVVLEASLGTARFRGEDERAARAWCNRILQRYVLDQLRRSGRHVELDSAPPMTAKAEADPFTGRDLEVLFVKLDTALTRLHRARDLATVSQNLQCHLEARLLGTSIEEQISRWADPGQGAAQAALRRARDRIYQFRRRGKVAGCQALRSLLETGEINPEEGDLLVKVMGCEDDGA